MPIEGAGLTRATVAVCTLNRADVLRGCLASLDSQLFDDDDVEVLVVDNGSTDRTPELLAQWSADSPKTRRSVREPLIGLVNARNAALAASDREVVIFIDDDALATPTWAMPPGPTRTNTVRTAPTCPCGAKLQSPLADSTRASGAGPAI